MTKVRFACFAALAALAAPASAGEVFAGVFAHAVDTPLSLDVGDEGGVDFQLGYRGGRIGNTPLQPYAFGSLNSKGDTNFAAVGLSAKFGDKLYIRPGLGIAVHTGSAANSTHFDHDHIDFGSRVLFQPEIGIGARLSDKASVEASWVHLSHATLFGRQNPGIDNIGVRFNWAL